MSVRRLLRFQDKVLAYLLDGQRIRAVWSQIEIEDGHLWQTRLILYTDLSLSAKCVLLEYNRRWAIKTCQKLLGLETRLVAVSYGSERVDPDGLD